MGSILIIPDRRDSAFFQELCACYGLGLEFNDFTLPKQPEELSALIEQYLAQPLPAVRTLHGAFFDVAVHSLDQDLRRISRQRVRQSMEIAARLSGQAVVIHTGFNPLLKVAAYEDNFYASSIAFYEEVLAEFTQIGLYLENVHEMTPAPLERYCAALGKYPNFGICLDVAHAHLTPTPETVWLDELAPYIRHFHINDNNGDEDTHLPLGEGNIDYAHLLPRMEQLCPEAHILLEVMGQQAIKKSLAYVQAYRNGGK